MMSGSARFAALLSALVFWLTIAALPAHATENPDACIGGGQEQATQNMLLPYRIGQPIADGVLLQTIAIHNDRIEIALSADSAEATLTLRAPNGGGFTQTTHFSLYKSGPARFDAAIDALVGRIAQSPFNPWQGCDLRIKPAASAGDELARREQPPGFGALCACLLIALLLGFFAFALHRRGHRKSGALLLSLAGLFAALFLTEALLHATRPYWMLRIRLQDNCYDSNPRGYFKPTRIGGASDQEVYCTWGGLKAWQECDSQSAQTHPDNLRILALGDSFTEAAGVFFSDSWPKRLQADLNAQGQKSTVINCGKSGANIADIAARYRRVVARHKPELVVYAWVLNDPVVPHGLTVEDIGEISFQFERPDQLRERLLKQPWLAALSDHSALARLIFSRYLTGRVAKNTEAAYKAMYKSPPHPRLVDALDKTAEMARDCERRGCRFVVAIWPLMYRLENYPFKSAHDLLKHELAVRGVAVVDWLPVFAGQDASKLWVHPSDYHPNEVAQDRAAAALAKTLLTKGWVAPPAHR